MDAPETNSSIADAALHQHQLAAEHATLDLHSAHEAGDVAATAAAVVAAQAQAQAEAHAHSQAQVNAHPSTSAGPSKLQPLSLLPPPSHDNEDEHDGQEMTFAASPDTSTASASNQSGPSGSGMRKKRKPSRRTIRKACDLCHSTKVKCCLPDPLQQPAVGPSGDVLANSGSVHRPPRPCGRCDKLAKECIFTPVVKRKSRKRKAIDGMEGLEFDPLSVSALIDPLAPWPPLASSQGGPAQDQSLLVPTISDPSPSSLLPSPPAPPALLPTESALASAPAQAMPTSSTSAADLDPAPPLSAAPDPGQSSSTKSNALAAHEWDVFGSFLGTDPLLPLPTTVSIATQTDTPPPDEKQPTGTLLTVDYVCSKCGSSAVDP
ncbi:hypothetical protein V8E36_002157 [Tilletia maclaganii]